MIAIAQTAMNKALLWPLRTAIKQNGVYVPAINKYMAA